MVGNQFLDNIFSLLSLLGMACKSLDGNFNASSSVMRIKKGKGLRDAVRLYNVPVEILTRVNGSVTMDCKPGPATVLTKEEDKVAEYLIAMPDMGYGLSRATVMTIAYTIVEVRS